MSQNIFICYRRTNSSSNFAALLFNHLEKFYSKDQIFKDFDVIKPGEDYRHVIEKALMNCDVLLVLIGQNWLAPGSDGKPKIFHPDDWVRMEISSILNDPNKKLIPVRFDEAQMPRSTDLPEDIQLMARRQTVKIRTEKFESDLMPLVGAIDDALGIQRDNSSKNEQVVKEVPEKSSSNLLSILIVLIIAVLIYFVIGANTNLW